jgi:hypothetical protein
MTESDMPDTSVSDGFRVNFSDKEASSEGRSAELLPRGNYHVKVTEGSIEYCGPGSKNPGKPYYNLECTIQSGPHTGRKLFTNAMLFEGALYTITQIMKSMGISVTAGQMEIPGLNEIIGTDFLVAVVKKPKQEVGDKVYDERNEINSFMKYDPAGVTQIAAGGAKKSGATSLMP